MLLSSRTATLAASSRRVTRILLKGNGVTSGKKLFSSTHCVQSKLGRQGVKLAENTVVTIVRGTNRIRKPGEVVKGPADSERKVLIRTTKSSSTGGPGEVKSAPPAGTKVPTSEESSSAETILSFDIPTYIHLKLNGQDIPTEGKAASTPSAVTPSATLAPASASPSAPSNNNNNREIVVSIEDSLDKKQKAMWGTVRALLQRMVIGVQDGYTLPLRMVGVGYRALMEDGKLSLKVGVSHPVLLEIPQGVTVSIPAPQRIILQGADWAVITQFAAKIREKRKPEPYNQKGIFVGDETIRKKEGKKR